MTMRMRVKARKTTAKPIWLPDIRRILLRIDDGRYSKNVRIVAAGGRIMPTDGKTSRRRWNDWESAIMVTRTERSVRSHQRYVRNAVRELNVAKDGLAGTKRTLAIHKAARDVGGRSTMQLNKLREWVETHMPSVREIATDGEIMRLRFCAAVLRGAGRYHISPNRLVIPAMWIGVNIDTGIVVESKSDGSRSGAFHPHAREDTGDPCAGGAIYRPAAKDISVDTLKAVLTGVEQWRLCYGDDHYHKPRDVARRVWDIVAHAGIGIAPIQGTSGRVYEDLNTLIRAEPWDGAVSDKWCCNCEVPYEACGCCPHCDQRDGECGCGGCYICGRSECSCCTYCETQLATWRWRGTGNEHQVCDDCGYCRLCGNAVASEPVGWESVRWFLNETDARRLAALATIEYGRGSHRPGDYSTGCNCSNCRAHTGWLNRQGIRQG